MLNWWTFALIIAAIVVWALWPYLIEWLPRA